jgi:hypothetical protein
VTTFFPAVNKNYSNMMNSSHTASCFWGWPSMWHSQIKYEWQRVVVAKYEFCGMLCRLVPDVLKALQSGKMWGSNLTTQHLIPRTCVFSNTAVRTSNLANTCLLFLNINQELTLYGLWPTSLVLVHLQWMFLLPCMSLLI